MQARNTDLLYERQKGRGYLVFGLLQEGVQEQEGHETRVHAELTVRLGTVDQENSVRETFQRNQVIL